MTTAVLALEDGSLFYGKSIGVSGETVGEVVFNTAMTGYQEILTDPSYSKQIVTLTYPHIGNVGTNAGDEEASGVHASGLVIRDSAMVMSNWRGEKSLHDYLVDNNTVAISDIDTRRLTRVLRDKGAMGGCVIAGDSIDVAKAAASAIAAARAFTGLKGMDLAKEVTTAETYSWLESVWDLETNQPAHPVEARFHVVAYDYYDYGVKRNILRMLVERGCKVTVVPAKTPSGEVLAMQPDGVFLSNGPGDPEPCDYAIEAIRQILETELPVFGICLGHQLLPWPVVQKRKK